MEWSILTSQERICNFVHNFFLFFNRCSVFFHTRKPLMTLKICFWKNYYFCIKYSTNFQTQRNLYLTQNLQFDTLGTFSRNMSHILRRWRFIAVKLPFIDQKLWSINENRKGHVFLRLNETILQWLRGFRCTKIISTAFEFRSSVTGWTVSVKNLSSIWSFARVEMRQHQRENCKTKFCGHKQSSWLPAETMQVGPNVKCI